MTNWASYAIESLRAGRKAVIHPHGNSMDPVIKSGQEVTLYPLGGDPQVGDIALVRVRGTVYLHWIKAKGDGRYQIANNKGHVNGWVGRSAIYGIVCK